MAQKKNWWSFWAAPQSIWAAKNLSGQLSNSMIDCCQTDTYLFKFLNRMITMMRNIRNDLVRRAIRWSSNGHLSLQNSFNQTLLPTAWIWRERHEKGTVLSCLGYWMWICDWQVNKVWSHGLLCNQNQQGRLKPNSSLLQSKHNPKSKAKPFL